MQEKENFQFAKLKNVLEFVWNSTYSSFYRNKYKKAGINLIKDVRTIKDFQQLPYLTKDELLNTSPYERVYCAWNKIEMISCTSGTRNANQPLIMFSTRKPGEEITKKKSLQKYKVKMCLILSNSNNGQRSILSLFSQDKMKKTKFFLGDISDFAKSARIAATLKIDSIKAKPTILTFFIPYLKKEYDLSKIAYIKLSGEFCSEERVTYFKQMFPNAYFDFSYGMSESSGGLSYRCSTLAKKSHRLFHLNTNRFYSELLDVENENELILTHLHTDIAFPLIRYKTGDAVKIQKESCACGEKQIMEVFGKLSFDIARIQGTTIYAQGLYKAIAPFKNQLEVMDFQMHIFEFQWRKRFMPKLVLHLVPKTKTKNKKILEKLKTAMEKKISNTLYVSSTLTLANLIERGVFLPFEVEFVDSLPTQAKRRHIVSHIT